MCSWAVFSQEISFYKLQDYAKNCSNSFDSLERNVYCVLLQKTASWPENFLDHRANFHRYYCYQSNTGSILLAVASTHQTFVFSESINSRFCMRSSSNFIPRRYYTLNILRNVGCVMNYSSHVGCLSRWAWKSKFGRNSLNQWVLAKYGQKWCYEILTSPTLTLSIPYDLVK